ncbi:MAG: zinc ABC transporter substrate-binding protein [Chloroflexota bacterium]|nr:MAG: zinc ABC transporter substrate-binding protein [Chloroflexota bacterium]
MGYSTMRPYKIIHNTPAALALLLALVSLLAQACSRVPEDNGLQPGKLNVMASTTIVADVVRSVGGEAVQVTSLLPPNSDPHSFEPTPQDVARMDSADVIFLNGAGMERPLELLIQKSGVQATVVSVSEGVALRDFDAAAGDVHEEDEHQGADPHVYMDPNNVAIWVDNIAETLAGLDPTHAEAYQANAQKYKAELENLDQWIKEQVAQTPVENRKLVSDHSLFGYFAERYGFTQVGAVIPSYTSVAEPSAQELAELQNKIRELGVKAIFVDRAVNPALSERIAEDTGIPVVLVYTGSLGEEGGEAGSYIEFIRYNVNAIVNALK